MAVKSKHLKREFRGAVIALLIAIASAGTATFAWYIYNTGAHTTTVSMAAGTSASLLISNSYDGEYKYSLPLAESKGGLMPVSTDKICNGFQHVVKYESREGSPSQVASIFDKAPEREYYMHTLYLKTTGDDMDIYVGDIGFENSDKTYPFSSATRVGFKVYKPGNTTSVDSEYIFEIDPDTHVPNPVYNTSTGGPGYVLNSSKWDNTTIKFEPYQPKNYAKIDGKTGEVIVTGDSKKIASCKADTPVRIDVYIWLEGCDPDCTDKLRATTLKEIAVKFSGNANTK